MPRWEYMTVIAIRQATEFDVWRAAYIDGKEQPDWPTSPPIYERMNEWGAAGWELVAVVSSATRVGDQPDGDRPDFVPAHFQAARLESDSGRPVSLATCQDPHCVSSRRRRTARPSPLDLPRVGAKPPHCVGALVWGWQRMSGNERVTVRR
jgi:hypothetical protein